jgi:transcriptional regulator of met regulon
MFQVYHSVRCTARSVSNIRLATASPPVLHAVLHISTNEHMWRSLMNIQLSSNSELRVFQAASHTVKH